MSASAPRTRSGRTAAALVAAVALMAGLVAGILWSPIAPGGSRPAAVAVPPADAAVLRRIEERLGAIEATLLRLEDRVESPSSAPPAAPSRSAAAGPPADDGAPGATAAPDPAALAELRAALARLERVVAAESERTRALLRESSLDGELLERMRTEAPPADWDAWEPILATWRADPAAARDAVDLLTAEQVLERFGRPDDVWSHEPVGTTWQYARDWDPVGETWGTEIILRLPEGYVTQLVVRGRDW